jgi:hypothetical protein
MNIGNLYIWLDWYMCWYFKFDLKRKQIYLGPLNFDWSSDDEMYNWFEELLHGK